MKKFEILWELPKCDTETWSEQILLDKSFWWTMLDTVTTNLPFVNISCHSLLAYRVSAEKAADNLMEIPLYAFCCVSLVSNFLLLWLISASVDSSLGLSCVGLSELPGLSWLCSHVWKVFDYHLFKYFLRPFFFLFFWDSYNVSTDAFNAVQEVSETTLISFPSFWFILFCGSDFHHCLPDQLLVLLSHLFCYWFLLVYFCPGEGDGNPLQYSCPENAMFCSLSGSSVYGVTRVGHNLATKPPVYFSLQLLHCSSLFVL